MPEPATVPPEQQPEEQTVVHVLVVDDDQVMRDMLQDVLEVSGYVVDTAATGEEALEAIQAKRYDLILTDIRMPGLDGFAVLEECRTIAPETDVIVMTGYASVDLAVECMKRGATDFVTKPFNVDHIQMIAQRTLETKALKAKAAETEYYQELALTDDLTDIYNKRYFQQLLATEIARSKRRGHQFVLVMLDIDDFKQFNDTNGHVAGDEALKHVAKILAHYSRTSDVVSRFGGEEFALILPEMSRGEGHLAAERLRKIVEETRIPGEENVPNRTLTVSVGMAVFPDDAEELTPLVMSADKALYAAKDRGKNCVVSADELD